MNKIALFLSLALSSLTWAGHQSPNSAFPLESMKGKIDFKHVVYISKLSDKTSFDWIEVPENFDDPQGKKIKIFYERINRSTKNSSIPIAFFYGGPGISPQTQIPPLLKPTKNNDLIIIHQRGTGLSTPLPKIDTKQNILRYRHYLSRAIVKDAEQVRKQLFGDVKWIITGQSFGSLIVQRYITLFPKSIHSAHAHGYAATSLPTPFAESRIIQHGENVKNYLKKYPKDLKKIKLISQYLEKNSISPIDKPEIKVQGKQALSFVSFIFMAMPNLWPQFSQVLDQVCPKGRVNAVNLNSFLQYMYFNPDLLFLGGKQDVLNLVFNRLEAYVTDGLSLSEYYQNIFAKLKQQGINIDSWLIGEEAVMHFSVTSPYRKMADEMDLGKSDPLLPSLIIKQLQAHPELNFYLYAGKLDSVAPAQFFEPLVKKSQGRIKLILLEGGHESFMHPKFWQTVREEAKTPKLKKAI